MFLRQLPSGIAWVAKVKGHPHSSEFMPDVEELKKPLEPSFLAGILNSAS
jgi:hypothetical protein